MTKKFGFISIELVIIGAIVIGAGFYAISGGEKRSLGVINQLDNAVNRVKEEQNGRIFIDDIPVDKQWYDKDFYINGYPVEPGLYDIDGNLIEKWENTGIDIEAEYGDVVNGSKQATYVINNKYPTTSIVVLPNGIKKIGENAFRATLNVNIVVIPKSVKTLSNRVFTYCPGLQQIVVDPSNKHFTSVNGVLYDKNITELLYYPYNGNLESYTLPKTVKKIYNYCFAQIRLKSIDVEPGNNYMIIYNGNLYSKDMKYLYYYIDKPGQTDFTVPEGVTFVYSYSFTNTSSLKKLTFPNSLRNLGTGVLEASSVEEIILNEGISTIQNWSLIGHNLTRINIPSTVNTIEAYAFTYTNRLTSVSFANPNGWKANGVSVDFTDPVQAATYIKNNVSKSYIRS